ncbi:MAG TPA: SRPBCC domain-containing protein [Acidimicrobiales bacterium]|nr:SRPBCC domain-containing protein [Acidimicrobiales bacterium]
MTEGPLPGSFLPDRHTFRLELTYPHPPGRVWRALTEPEHLAAWFMPLELDLRVGGRAVLVDYGQLEGTPPAEGIVTAVEPERLLEYRFPSGPWEWPPCTLRFELQEEDGRCRLVFSQQLSPDFVPTWRDFDRFQIGGPGTHLPGACAGWQGFFEEGLSRFLEGRVTDIYGDDDDRLMDERSERYEPLVRAASVHQD